MHSFVIQRDMEGNFSFLIKELYRYMLEEMFERKSDFTITDNSVMFGFRGFINLSSTFPKGFLYRICLGLQLLFLGQV